MSRLRYYRALVRELARDPYRHQPPTRTRLVRTELGTLRAITAGPPGGVTGA
jgi:hypothetical protein